MKSVVTIAGLFAVTVIGSVYFIKTGRVASNTPNEAVIVANNTVTGNITEDLKSKDETSLLSEKKVLSKLNHDPKRIVYFEQEFSEGTVALAVEKLKKLEKESNARILLAINSPGGSVVDGAELISQMESSSAPVDTVCLKLCASMAAMTHSYGSKRYALDRAIIMYHPATAGVQGQVPNMVSLLKTLTRYIDKMNSNVVKRSNMSKEEFDALVAYELWIDSEDALKRGLIDAIVTLKAPHTDPNVQPQERLEDIEHTNPNRKIDFESISPYAKDLW
jgi:ATP-dependent Clp endopeptidase proteolytic subunit ClpP